MMTRALVVLMLASVVAAAPATAQDARLEAARKEGTVVWYTSLALTSAPVKFPDFTRGGWQRGEAR